jgi:hypothetical protein
LTRDQKPALTVYKETIDQPLAVCELNIQEGLFSKTGQKMHIAQKTLCSLLIGLCWHLFTPFESASPVEVGL